MLHDEFWAINHFGVKRSKVKVTRYKKVAAWVIALL